MVTYIKSDLKFILEQIKIAEAHAGGQPLFGPGGLLPTYNLSFGLRTVDGSYNHLLPGQEQWGAADREFVELMTPQFRTVMGPVDINGPAPGGVMQFPFPYTPGNDADGPMPNATPGDVIDPSVRLISNLLVDQTLANPAAILTALQNAGIDDPGMVITSQISAAYAPLKPLFKTLGEAERAEAAAAAAAAASPGNQALQDAAAAAAAALAAAQAAVDAAANVPGGLNDLLAANGITMDGTNLHIPNFAPDEGLSAPFNSWFTLFGQFFDHGLDLVNKGGSGTVMIPLQPDDPLYVEGSNTNFMVLTRATVTTPGADGILGDDPDTPEINEGADDVHGAHRPVNTTTSYVDQNQTYTSHPSHQVFLRQYVSTPDGPAATGHLIEGANGGMATWGEVKTQAATLLGIELTDLDVGKVPLLRTDPYGNFIPGTNGFPQLIYGIGLDGIPNTADDLVVEGNPANPVDPSNLFDAADPALAIGAIRTNHAFLADIAHNAVPTGLEDGDITIGLENPGNEPGVYDDELLDAHFVAGDGRVNENIGLTAVHHVFHSEHNRLVDHTKDVAIADAQAMLDDGASQAEAVAFLNEWLVVDVTEVPDSPAEIEALVWDGERLFQAAKFGTEMQYQHLVFEEFARKVQPTINTFLVPDGFDTMMDPSIFAEFAHVVYRFGHSMLTESIDQFDPNFNANHISLIQGFLNPTAFTSVNGVDDDVAAGAIIRGMTRQVGNEIDEFVTGALRNNLLGLPLDLATINLARGRDTGVPSLNEARRTFYEATNQDARLKPYESWVDYAGHLKHEASIINFIAAYGTHQTILDATTIEQKRDAAMALVGLSTDSSEALALSNASFEADSLATGAPNVITDPLGNYTLTPPTGWVMSGTGGLFDPAAGITNEAAIDGTNVVWLGQGGVLSRDTGVVLEAGASYSLSVDIGDRTDLGWPGGTARLVSTDGTVLAEQALAAPANGAWTTVMFQTAAIGAAVAGQTLSIVIEQSGASTDQILVDDVRLSVLRPLPPLDEDDRQAFLNGTGIYADDLGGLENVDLWIGGLAEEIMPFGGMLGATFNFVFEQQMELLQSGDRFYYLQRLDGLHLFGEMENNSFAAMMMRNTNATHLPSDVFSTPGFILEVDKSRQFNPDTGVFLPGPDGVVGDNPLTPADESLDDIMDTNADPVGGGILTQLVIRNNPGTVGPDNNYLRYTGGDHVVLGGTDPGAYNPNGRDILVAGIGDDTVYGDGGDDLIEGGFGNDILNGGAGDDIIKDSGGDDNIKAGDGNDVVHAGPGLDLVMGGAGQDFIFLGTDEGSEVFAGEGNDFIYGNRNAERILGNEGNDWIETGTFDGAPGDNFDEIFAHDGIDGHDVFIGDGGFDEFIGEGGDDIMVGSTGRGKMAGMSGFDWATYKDSGVGATGVNVDLSIPIVFDEAPTLPPNAALDEFQSMEGLSGSSGNDVLRGSNILADERLPYDAQTNPTPLEGYRGSALDADGIARISGLQAVLGAGVDSYIEGDIILGGDGNDLIAGQMGDDIIDGDKWLDVYIAVTGHPTVTRANSMTELAALMFNGEINPSQLEIRREIVTANGTGDVDIAVFSDVRANYTITPNANGTITVTHVTVTDGLESDGSDTLNNIERLRFSDIEIGVNLPPTGAPVVSDLTPTEGQQLTLNTAGIADPNGLGAFSYQWQSSANGTTWTNIAGATAASFTPQDLPLTAFGAQAGLQLRAVVSFTDGGGTLETVASAPTGPTGANWDGIIFVTNTFDGTEGNDIADGGDAIIVGGVDNLNGNGGDDDLEGNSGNDVINGGAGNDLVAGEAGTDVAVFAGGLANFSLSTTTANTNILVTDNSGAEGVDTLSSIETLRFNGVNYTVQNGTQGNNNPINGGGGSQALFGFGGVDMMNGGAGADIVNGGHGNDTIVQSSPDGRDLIDGGVDVDTYQLNGVAGAEVFRVYTRAAAVTAGLTGLGLNTEIVVTRNTNGPGGAVTNANIIAELDNIEEIRVNTLQVTAPPGTGGTNGGDTIQVIGDFTGTSLNFNTITIDGDEGDDTVDISALSSAHRIVFRSNGGNDTIVGTLREQDVIELPAGAVAGDYELVDNGDGTQTLVSASHSVTFSGEGVPTLQYADADDDEDDDDDDEDDDDNDEHDDDDDENDDDDQHDDDDDDTSGDDDISGTSGDDRLRGGSGDDDIRGGSGDDVVRGGSGQDHLRGGSGDDRLFGGSDGDILAGGSGDDELSGGSGDDHLIGGSGDDTLTGGSGEDLFAFDDDDVVTDFVIGEDHVDISGLGVTAATFASLVTIISAGDDALVTIGSQTLRLSNVDGDALTAESFLMADEAEDDALERGVADDDGFLLEASASYRPYFSPNGDGTAIRDDGMPASDIAQTHKWSSEAFAYVEDSASSEQAEDDYFL